MVAGGVDEIQAGLPADEIQLLNSHLT
jgi:hypothetical protein